MSDPTIEALRRLVAREGGCIPVADKIGANDQSIYQIVAGVKLKSGNPKGVGRRLREKLEAAYPGWMNHQPVVGEEPPAAALPGSVAKECLTTASAGPAHHAAGMAAVLASMPATERNDLADLLAMWAKQGAPVHLTQAVISALEAATQITQPTSKFTAPEKKSA